MVIYKVARETRWDEDNGTYAAFGIRAMEEEGQCQYIPDISLNEHEVLELANRLNVLGLSVEHFRDVVEDFVESRGGT
ncbi:MAG: DUF6514 family protein [Eubacteriales bacterium]|jgi:hypothetical protein